MDKTEQQSRVELRKEAKKKAHEVLADADGWVLVTKQGGAVGCAMFGGSVDMAQALAVLLKENNEFCSLLGVAVALLGLVKKSA